MPTTADEKRFVEELSELVILEIPTRSLDSVIDWIAKNLDPDAVFPEKDLEYWAENNGYIKKD